MPRLETIIFDNGYFSRGGYAALAAAGSQGSWPCLKEFRLEGLLDDSTDDDTSDDSAGDDTSDSSMDENETQDRQESVHDVWPDLMISSQLVYF